MGLDIGGVTVYTGVDLGGALASLALLQLAMLLSLVGFTTVWMIPLFQSLPTTRGSVSDMLFW